MQNALAHPLDRPLQPMRCGHVASCAKPMAFAHERFDADFIRNGKIQLRHA